MQNQLWWRFNLRTQQTKRTKASDVSQIVDEAIAAVDAGTLDTADAEEYLRRMGHTAPATELVNRVARDRAILAILDKRTGAAFNGQIGKIGFINRDKAIEQANAYLNRRNAGHRSRWNK